MPIVAALPAIAGGLGAAASAKSLFSGPGGGSPQMPNISSGINQTQIDNAVGTSSNALKSQQDLVNAIQAQGGLGNQSQVYDQLQQIAAGQGPNPAQVMLNNTTGQNVAQQAALIASQRGASANPALIARQAANTGAQIQQNAAGQGALLQAQQSLNALGQAGSLANQQAAQQLQAQQNYTQNAETYHNNLLGAQANYNNAVTGAQGNVNTNNAALAKTRAEQLGDLTGNLSGAAGTIAGLGGKTTVQTPVQTTQNVGGYGTMNSGVGLAKGGEVPAQSPVMIHLTGSGVKMAVGGSVGSQLKAGGKVPGKPVVGGAKNSFKNDTIAAKLSPGEIVIPRSVTQGKDPVKGAAAFVAATMAKGSKSLPKKK